MGDRRSRPEAASLVPFGHVKPYVDTNRGTGCGRAGCSRVRRARAWAQSAGSSRHHRRRAGEALAPTEADVASNASANTAADTGSHRDASGDAGPGRHAHRGSCTHPATDRHPGANPRTDAQAGVGAHAQADERPDDHTAALATGRAGTLVADRPPDRDA